MKPGPTNLPYLTSTPRARWKRCLMGGEREDWLFGDAIESPELLRSELMAPSLALPSPPPSPPPSPAAANTDVPFLSGPLASCCKATVSASVASPPTPTRWSRCRRAFAIWPKSLLVVMSGAKALGDWFMPSSMMASVREGQFMVSVRAGSQRRWSRSSQETPTTGTVQQASTKSLGKVALYVIRETSGGRGDEEGLGNNRVGC